MTTVYKFKAYYTTSGVGTAPDPAPVCTVINMADDSKLADAQATSASTNMPGLYSYSYSGADGLDLVAFFHTTSATTDQKDLASYTADKITTNLNADVAGVETKIDTIDGIVDDILTDTGTTLPGTLTTIEGKLDTADTVVDAIKAKTDNLPSDPADDSDLDTSIAAVKSVVDAVKAKTDNLPSDPADESLLEAAIAAVSGLDAAGVRTAIGLSTANLDTQLSAINSKTTNLPSDPADQSVLAGAIAGLSIPTVAEIREEMDDNSTKLANLDDTITSRASAADYTEARAVKLDHLDMDMSGLLGGSGEVIWTRTIEDASGNPIAGVTVELSTDAAKTDVIAQQTSDTNGLVTFQVDAGTYYLWKKKFGWNFSNPEAVTIA